MSKQAEPRVAEAVWGLSGPAGSRHPAHSAHSRVAVSEHALDVHLPDGGMDEGHSGHLGAHPHQHQGPPGASGLKRKRTALRGGETRQHP